MMETLFSAPKADAWKILSDPRGYQSEDHDAHFRLTDDGSDGTMTRIFTGGGKTYCACLKSRTWLARGHDYYTMVLSYEKQLVWQFAQEIEDFLGVTPGIEMDDLRVDPEHMPRIIVASRQSLLIHDGPTKEQIDELLKFDVKDIGSCTKKRCEAYLRHLRKGQTAEIVLEDIEKFNSLPEVKDGAYSRVRKFDWRLNWLVIFDEAHRHSHHLTSVGHVADWFARNPKSKRSGMTATPKVSSGVSLGHKMFPDIAIDYPLYHVSKPCAVKDGFAVPYVQKYIEVEGVDFKAIKKIAGDFSDDELEKALGEEATLAKLVSPMLDLVGERKTLVFSPGVEMAKNVARFINARSRAKCQICEAEKWYPTRLIGDGASCQCGRLISPEDVNKSGEQAKALWGEVKTDDRKAVYRGHQAGEFQFLSVCNLCREGYNDPDISAVAVFRPVSKKASSLAEQMKGRSCRTQRKLIDGLKTREERLVAIAASSKPNALIIDLVGITGLADCASTVQIYADGLPDEVKEKAAAKLVEAGLDETVDVEAIVMAAKAEIDEERERVRQERENAERRERERAERRAKADAEVNYTTHDVGTGKNKSEPTEKQLNKIKFYGMDLVNIQISKNQASRMIGQFLSGMSAEEVARTNRIKSEQWKRSKGTWKQIEALSRRGVKNAENMIPVEIAQAFDWTNLHGSYPDNYAAVSMAVGEIAKAKTQDDLTSIAKRVRMDQGDMSIKDYQMVVRQGQKRREELNRKGA